MSSFNDMLPMYNGINGSPTTTLTTQYNTGENISSITVRDGTVLPDAPNICTIYTSAGTNSGVAIIKYATKTDNVLSDISVEYKNTDSELSFPSGSFISRKYSELDHTAFKTNIEIIADITKALIEYIKPTPSILTFTIPDLPPMMPIGSRYVGEHVLTHKEYLPLFIDDNMELYENNIKILEFKPSSVDKQETFIANMRLDTTGEYTYTLKCRDVNGNTISKQVKTIAMENTLYIGHSTADTMTTAILNTFPVSEVCYDGMVASITANNDYVWFCIAQPCTIVGVTSSGFVVPMEPVQVVYKQVASTQVAFNCYRTTAQILAGYENKFKLSINFGD